MHRTVQDCSHLSPVTRQLVLGWVDSGWQYLLCPEGRKEWMMNKRTDFVNDEAIDIQAIEKRILRRDRRARSDCWHTGGDLKRVKDTWSYPGGSTFYGWCFEKFGYSDSTVDAYINAYTYFSLEVASRCGLDKLSRLRTMPDEDREYFIARIMKGEQITVAEIRAFKEKSATMKARPDLPASRYVGERVPMVPWADGTFRGSLAGRTITIVAEADGSLTLYVDV